MIRKFVLSAALTCMLSCKKETSENPEAASGKDTIAPVEKSSPKQPKTAVYNWQTELCTHTGNYDPDKVSKKQLDDTYYLWWNGRGLKLFDPIDKAPKRIFECDYESWLEELTRQYNENKAKFESLQLAEGKVWEDLRQAELRDLKERYDIYVLRTKAFCDPKILLEEQYKRYCDEYAPALASGTPQLMKAWEQLIIKQMKTNGAPDLLYNRYSTERQSADSIFYARKYVLTFGWYNCANHNIYHTPDNSYFEDFEKLFTNVKSECDEP